MDISNQAFKRIIVLFWAAWWLIAFLTDLLGGLKQIGVLHADWISNTNYPFLVQSLKQDHVPDWLTALFFIFIIAWLLISTLLFIQAALAKSGFRFQILAKNAFIVSLSLWLVFFISDQIIMNFDLEANHMVQGGFQLLTFLALYLLPE